MKEIEIEIKQLTPDQNRAWCDTLRVDWRNYIDEKSVTAGNLGKCFAEKSLGIGGVMPTIKLKSHSRRKGKPIGYKGRPGPMSKRCRSDQAASGLGYRDRFAANARSAKSVKKGGPLKPSQEVHHVVR